MADKLQANGRNKTPDQNGTGQNGAGQNGTGQKNGPGENGTSQNSTGQNGTACSCEFPKIYTDDDGKTGKIKRIIKTETLQMNDGSRYTRSHVCGNHNPNEWREVAPPVRPKTPPRYKSLWVVRQTQISRNPHWSLFAAFDDDNDGMKGRIWQVNGDPDVGMFYAHRSSVPGVAIFISASFLDSILVCENLTEDWEARVDEIANTIRAPGPSASQSNKAKGRKLDLQRGTCRTWVWEVLDRLVEEGITTATVAAKARELQPKPLV